MTNTPTETEVKTEVTWTPQAWDRRAEIMTHAYLVGSYYGERHQDAELANIAHCLLKLFSMGPTTVYCDGDGLLFVSNYITIGMVWFRDSDEAMLKRLNADRRVEYQFDEIRPDWPRTGEWSLHS